MADTVYKNGRITAVIPVKGNSSRLPGKNALPFAGSNLLVNKIRQLKQVSGIHEILVSSDSDALLEMAANENVRAIKRPYDLADETRPFGELVRYIHGLLTTEHLMWAPVTSPTLDEDFYEKAVETYYKVLEKGFDSLTTTLPFKHFLFGSNGPLNFNPFAAANAVTNSNDLPDMDLWTCGCSIIPIILAYEKKYIFGEKVYRYEVSPYQAIDIDTAFDYEAAKAIWNICHAK